MSGARRVAASVSISGLALAAVALGGSALSVDPAGAIPAFSRTYRTGCTTCHTAPPKLNPLGEAFRLNGYRFPENDRLLRREEATVPLGADAWKEAWPRSIWPAELPAMPPLSLRLINDLQVTADDSEPFDWTYRFPAEVHLLGGGSLGEGVGVYAEIHWIPDEGVDLAQAKVPLTDPLPFLPERALNVRVGKQALHLLSMGDSRTDRAGRLRFLWTEFDPGDLALVGPGGEDVARSANRLELRQAQPAVEVDGLVAGRLLWAVGVSQGSAELGADDDDFKDLYWKVRWKAGGLGLDGLYETEEERPAPAEGGQLLDHGLVLEHFGYRGAFAVADGARDERTAWGVAVRWLAGRADLGVGYVRGENEDPWDLEPEIAVRHESLFGRVEYLLYPWLVASLRAESLEASIEGESPFRLRPDDRIRVAPGLIALVRQNVRAVVEAELYGRHEGADADGRSLPHNLWFRLDVAF